MSQLCQFSICSLDHCMCLVTMQWWPLKGHLGGHRSVKSVSESAASTAAHAYAGVRKATAGRLADAIIDALKATSSKM